MTPGDAPDVLVAMNPAALKANLGDLPRGADIIVNTDEFTKRNLAKVGYADQPARGRLAGRLQRPPGRADLDDGRGAQGLRHHARRTPSGPRTCSRSGCCPGSTTARPRARSRSCSTKFAKTRADPARPTSRPSTRAGTSARPPRTSRSPTRSSRPSRRPGTYRNISGNLALSYGLVAASQRAGLPLFLGSYPITPASDILHELSKHKRFGVRTFQAEDEIAGIGAALGAAFGGALGVTSTSGPGLALKAETIGLAVSLELPLIIVDVQRGGPSTGLPTKTEQADLLQAMFGRNGESPVPIVAPRSPADCFDAAIEAARIATTYRTPVILLSDGYLANGSEPWRDPGGRRPARPARRVRHRAQPDPRRRQHGVLALPARPGDAGPAVGGARHGRASSTASAASRRPTARATSPTTRPTTTSWCAPGRPRSTGSPSSIPPLEVDDPTGQASVLVLGWGSTYGPIGAACRTVRAARHRGRAGPPAPPQPVPRQHRRGAAAATTGCWSPR